ncbi:hypothetical protein AQZ52_02035 [Novosphingobium fuchskuhlense]|uniref:site-specific DNA-methyltransferase (adenine-specific) n=1 Tax=Novosphingobium fuchskuhlense TaxID=1117702 RepID=A0A124JVB4_9SPHN|nr:N-6 DNA methylase [Novosphingobium fuchskuhlense]KUR72109.1 hypothetical protein AQZ52_02035 [Novosphingobium fuchskuhlense]
METQQKIFDQIVDSLRETGMTDERVIELALQVIVWEKLSHDGALPEELQLQQKYADNAQRGAHAMSKLAELDGVIGEAFATANINTLIVSADNLFNHLRRAIETLLRLRKSGMLEQSWSLDVFEGLNSRTGSFALPPELAELMVALADVQPEESVYLPWDATAQCAMRASQQGCDALIETPMRTSVPALINLLMSRQFDVIYGDPIRQPGAIGGGRLRKFDSVIAFPPFGMRYDFSAVESDLWGRFPERTQSGSVLAIRHALAQSKGRCVLAVPNSFLFGSGPETVCRQQLIERGQISAVIALPPILPHAPTLPFSLMLLDAAGGSEFIRFIGADDDRFRSMVSRTRAKLTDVQSLAAQALVSEPSDVMRMVSIHEVQANDYNLEVGRYLLDQAAQRLQQRLQTAETIVLGDTVELIRSLPLLRDGEGLSVHEVGAADLPPFGYIESASREVTVEGGIAKRNAHQFLRPFDVVLIIKGSVGKVGIVPASCPSAGEGGWIASQSAIVLRSRRKDPLEAHALAVQLRSPVGQELLKMITSGASILLIQVRELQQMRLFAFDTVTATQAQNAIAAETDIQAQIIALGEHQASVAADLWTRV